MHVRPCSDAARIGLVHVRHDDRDVLKPAIVAARIHRNWPSLRRQVFGEFDGFVAKFHPDDSRPQPEEALQPFVTWAGDFNIGYFLKRQNPGEEVDRAIHIADS